MFKRRDIPPVLLLLLLIILVMLTLSQILVVHNGRYGKNVHSMRKLQLELRQMDINLHTMMMQNVPSIELNRRLLQNSINSQRVAHIIAEAAQPDRRFSATRRARRPGGRNATHSWDRAHGVGGGSRKAPSNGSGIISLDLSVEERAGVGAGDRQSHVTGAEPVTEGSVEGRGLAAAVDTRSGTRSGVEVTSVESNFPTVDLNLPDGNRTVASTHSGTRRFQRLGSSPGGDRIAEVETREPNAGVQRPGNGTSTFASSSIAFPVFTNSTESGQPVNQTVSVGFGSHRLPLSLSSTSSKPYCPPVPPGIKGRIFINFEHKHDYTETDIIGQNPELLEGGAWRPTHCIARHRVAIIIPYRDRKEHLTILLSHLHPMLQRQQLDYRIYVIEQYGDYTFNKARIMNIAFVEALKQHSFQCFVFHDVDLVPEDDRNMYSCPMQPRHMSVAIDEMGYKLAYQELVGGVLNMRTEHFQSVNGYSNLYWGWGAEDDDMAYRIMYVGLKITRPPESVARYKMIKHTKRKPSDWRKRAKLLYTGTRRFQFDGLNSLQYKLLSIENNPLCTHILVDIGKPPKGF